MRLYTGQQVPLWRVDRVTIALVWRPAACRSLPGGRAARRSTGADPERNARRGAAPALCTASAHGQRRHGDLHRVRLPASHEGTSPTSLQGENRLPSLHGCRVLPHSLAPPGCTVPSPDTCPRVRGRASEARAAHRSEAGPARRQLNGEHDRPRIASRDRVATRRLSQLADTIPSAADSRGQEEPLECMSHVARSGGAGAGAGAASWPGPVRR